MAIFLAGKLDGVPHSVRSVATDGTECGTPALIMCLSNFSSNLPYRNFKIPRHSESRLRDEESHGARDGQGIAR
ncbi:hypothetical protein A2Y83_04075 [Candidatus Falkowbacteria bacterium RBG_13_39_14]|uniref:Uncharacterized protein n=1 Tax=Candidatus Falkowbacteria bacterium RBG_13_39_14 TaxID=1797985 RepID=A0A1F5S671_9BACT|nr:MAG: hypothetical protein A2Y83_04075 [Candidatus Falkowbacteria bacterium RBG_13_39_14]